jgi:hypothetical protein
MIDEFKKKRMIEFIDKRYPKGTKEHKEKMLNILIKKHLIKDIKESKQSIKEDKELMEKLK